MEIWGLRSLQLVDHRHERDENFRIIAKSFSKEAICNAQQVLFILRNPPTMLQGCHLLELDNIQI